MAIIVTFNGVPLLDPGSYSRILAENLSGFPLQPTGTVGIIGNALGGQPRVLDVLEKTSIQSAKERYKEGEIADALELLVSPSGDPRIVNGASKVVVYKVNNSTQSTSPLNNPNAQEVIKLDSKNYGSDENNLIRNVSQGEVVDADAEIDGSIDGPFTLAGGETLILRANGVTYTYTESLGVGVHTAAALAADMDSGGNWAPAKPVLVDVNPASVLKIRVRLDPSVVIGGELDYGYLEVDPTSTIDTVIGVIGSNRGVKGSRIIVFSKGGNEETTLEMGGVNVSSILYTGAGTSCLLDVLRVGGELRLKTTCAGAAADNLDILLEDSEGRNKLTVSELAVLINSNASYTASNLFPNGNQNANELDYYDDLEIIDVAGVLRRDVFDAVDYMNTFLTAAVATRIDNIYRAYVADGLDTLFTGAGDGTSANGDWADGFNAFKQIRINSVVPLISKDIGAVTIDSINALAKGHVKAMWATDGGSERNAYVSKLGTKDELLAAAKSLNDFPISICGQQVRVLDRTSTLVWQDPWAKCCIAAGMQQGSEVGEPITKKILNVNDVRVLDSSWDPTINKNEMIAAGILFSQPLDTGGHRWVVGNTTWSRDGSFVWNRISVVEAAGFIVYDLRYNLDLVFTGTKARTGTAEAIANFIRNRMSVYLENDITVGDDRNDQLGYRKLRVELTGSRAAINLAVTPVQGVDFTLPTIYLEDIRQSA